MVKHIILWKLKEEFEGEEKQKLAYNIKEQLEGLYGKIPGLNYMNIIVNPLESSNVDVMMDSAFDDEEALKVYQKHPEHVKVADTYVRPYTASRSCIDYEE